MRRWFFLILLTLGMFSIKPVLGSTSSSNISDEFGWKFAYDDSGRISKLIDAAGRTTDFRYSFDKDDRLRKLVRTTADGSNVILQFDERGLRTSMRDSARTMSYGYDDLGRLKQVQREGTPAVTYSYDTHDRIKVLQVGDFYRIEYIYDFRGRLESMETPAGIIRYEYLTGQGKVVRTLPNGVKTFIDHAPNGELRKITHGKFSNPSDTRYQVLAEYNYGYRPDGLIESIKERGIVGQFERSYKYDKVGRLIQAIGPKGRQYTYEYDSVGNRVKATSEKERPQTFIYDWAGRITSRNGNRIEHDTAGNLTSMSSIDGKKLRYRYNQESQLIETNGGDVSYQYDGDGLLIARATRNTRTIFIPDPISDIWRPLVMIDKEGLRTLVVWSGGIPLAIVRKGRTDFLLHDHLGSVRLVVDDLGHRRRHLDYGPFGEMSNTKEKSALLPRFSGLFWDQESRLYLTRTRAYSTRLGRFLQADSHHFIPAVSPESVSPYGYCGADPVNFVDRGGTSREWWQIARETFDRKAAAKWYADQTKKALDEARGYGIMAGLKASMFDLARYSVTFGKESHAKDWYAEQQPKVLESASGSGFVAGLKLTLLDLGARRVGGRTSAAKWYADQHHAALNNAVKSGVAKATFKATAMDLLGGYIGGKETRGQKIGGVAFALGGMFTGGRIPPVQSTLDDAMKGIKFGQSFISSVYNSAEGNYKGAIQDILGMSGTVLSSRAKRMKEEAKQIYQTPDTDSASVKRARSLEKTAKILEGVSIAKDFGMHAWKTADAYKKPESYPLLHSLSSADTSLTPSPVGGVYLGGSGQALESIGLVDGISLDTNNNLILLSKAGEEIDLPPLRMDDLVTVFRSVYLNGEGPTVTIDPNPVDPEGSAMIVRHSKATENTYVGWILFQADRLMKGYTLGADNNTAKDIKSAVPGYDKVLNTIYFGGESPEKLRKNGKWERFWIVPAEARRFGTNKTELTLFDVPLKVKTQSMKWVKGELKDDLKGKSSPGATAFTDWFTGKYDQIAKEQYLMPPPESGITQPVPVFTELRRIALITAIAEKLRNQGTPLPFWMRDYEVQSVPIEKFTPGLKVTRSNQRVTARVYGGAQMSAADKDVKDFTPVSNLANLPKAEQQSIRKKIELVDTLEKAVQDEMISVEPLKVHQFKHKGAGFQGVILPGNNTQALAPGRLEEVDMSVPIEGGHSIQLVRYYNSFFHPNGLWGKGWTFDLPRLGQIKVPTHRAGNKVSYQTAYELITPLNSSYTRFSQIEKVPSLNDSRLQVPDHPSDFFGIADSKPLFLTVETKKLIRKDGSSWHFSKAGQLIAVENGGFKTVYERNTNGRLTRIIGVLGKQLMASIDLKYNKSGKLSAAVAYKSKSESDKTIINYRYDNVGRLSSIESESGIIGIRYKGSWVTAITYQAKDPKGTESEEIILRSFEYNPRGQLLNDMDVNGKKTNYQVVSDSKGSTITTVSGEVSGKNSIRYDPSFRPVEARYADGRQVTWDYPNSGDSIVHIKETDGADVRIVASADRRQRVIEFNNDYKIVSEFDSAERLTSLSENGQTLLEQEWSPLGKLRVARNESQAEHFEYDEEGLLSRTILAPPHEKGNFSRFQETRFDPAGRPVEIKDNRGMHLSAHYDANGALTAMFNHRDGNNYGYTINRDPSGRIQKVESSWEDREYAYDTNGFIKNLAITNGGMSASAEWQSGLLHKVKQFDGGESTMSYYTTPGKEELIKKITTPNQLTMAYEYDPENQLRGVNVGNIYQLKIDYDSRGNLIGWQMVPPGQPRTRQVTIHANPGTASSSVLLLRSIEARRADSKFASEGMPDALILDHSVVEGKPSLLLTVNGKVRSINDAVAVEFNRLLKNTANRVGPLGELPKEWGDFVEKYLSGYSKVQIWEAHNHQTVRLKPRLIIKSNQANYKYANLERIPVLMDNFNVYVTQNPGVTATSLVKKIRNMPRLGRDNVLFLFRLPEMEAELQKDWENAIEQLQEIVGKDNAHLDPSKTELQTAMNRQDKNLVVFEFTHTHQGIVLKDNEMYQADDIMRGESLSHIKYLIGLSCCNLQKLEDGRFVDSLQKQGVGIVDGPLRAVDAPIGLRRLKQMIEIMRNIKRYENLPIDYFQDVIDQLQKIEQGGMIKVGERVPRGGVKLHKST